MNKIKELKTKKKQLKAHKKQFKQDVREALIYFFTLDDDFEFVLRHNSNLSNKPEDIYYLFELGKVNYIESGYRFKYEGKDFKCISTSGLFDGEGYKFDSYSQCIEEI